MAFQVLSVTSIETYAKTVLSLIIGSQYYLSFRWELLALCRGLEVMQLLPVMLLVLVTMGEPELWVRLWIIV